MSLRAMRAILQEVVEVRRRRGDDAIDYLDGLELLGHDDAHHLPDGIHPSAAGCALIAGRFAAHFGAQ
jgi:lysophospholipase L1-like esterase